MSMPKPHPPAPNASLAGHLLDQYAGRIARSRRPYIIGLSGLQGSGKSTLAREMKRAGLDVDLNRAV